MNNFTNNQELTYQIVENATIFPCENRDGKTYAGIVDETGNGINESLLFRTNTFGQLEQLTYAEQHRNIEEKITTDCIFAGYWQGHYGHFLLENLARWWYIKKNPDIPLIWLPYLMGPKKIWQQELFSLLNINNPEIIIEKTTFVKQIIVPEPGLILQHFLAEEQAQALVILKSQPIKNKKVWLSRSQVDPLDSLSRPYNENQLEELLIRQGWTIFHPQQHSITKQIQMLADAEHIAGFEGSAFHTLLLIETQAKITIFGRRQEGCIVHPTYITIAKVKKLQQTEHYIPCSEIRRGGGKYVASVYLIHSYKEIIEILNNKED